MPHERRPADILRDAQAAMEAVAVGRMRGEPGFQSHIRGDAFGRRKLEALAAKPEIKIAVYAYGHAETDYAIDLSSGRRYHILGAWKERLLEVDVLIGDWNFFQDQELYEFVGGLMADAERNFVGIVWLIDHHHMWEMNMKLASEFDYFVYAHPSRVDYLNALAGNNLGNLLCYVNQWSPGHFDRLAAEYLDQPRRNTLYGGFRGYGFPRDEFLVRANEAIADSDIFVTPFGTPRSQDRYACLDHEGRFREWASHKTSVVAAVNQDIPIRLFDALATGHVPIVSDDILGLEFAIPAEDQLTLPVLRYRANDIGDLARMRDRAIAAFDRGGPEAMRARSAYARSRHMIEARMAQFAAMLDSRLASV